MSKVTAEEIIAAEVDLQDRLWGALEERADTQNGELHLAAIAQLTGLQAKQDGEELDPFGSESYAKTYIYPENWSGDLRDYGSDIANLAVAAAFLVQEIRRKLRRGEPTDRLPRSTARVAA